MVLNPLISEINACRLRQKKIRNKNPALSDTERSSKERRATVLTQIQKNESSRSRSTRLRPQNPGKGIGPCSRLSRAMQPRHRSSIQSLDRREWPLTLQFAVSGKNAIFPQKQPRQGLLRETESRRLELGLQKLEPTHPRLGRRPKDRRSSDMMSEAGHMLTAVAGAFYDMHTEAAGPRLSRAQRPRRRSSIQSLEPREQPLTLRFAVITKVCAYER